METLYYINIIAGLMCLYSVVMFRNQPKKQRLLMLLFAIVNIGGVIYLNI
jgi:hypothetical protein